ncbi:NDP-hexose 2,3-dehydratase family protein [Nocardioides zeae]|uniref:NDP-hexose 2,3-dehydratase n=1 Tax=Nocardioides zeae TaxID=1457234 RepID=A0A6P0HHM6_9ACTN|nr:NDP-hexose 2,3-dehydratase family protein [Nocardioides zeae]NEN77800.1 NDP-hexose 2,3-dehydratase [Nocardioides zeae]
MTSVDELAPRRTTPPGVAAVQSWLADVAARHTMTVRQVDLDDIAPWRADPDTGDLVHPSGGFFRVTGLHVGPVADADAHPGTPRPEGWSQPIIDQPEVGILGFVAARAEGRLHVLVQAKAEPGNRNGVQLSPTVQATWSNYTGKHGGASVPYLSWFTDAGRGRVLVDVLQSEQAAWFFQKRNRNMLVLLEDREVLEVLPGFRWVPLEDLYGCLLEADLVNMDARTVLSCLPLHLIGGWEEPVPGLDDRLARTVRASLAPTTEALHPYADLLSWLTGLRSRPLRRAALVPLREVGDGWHHVDGELRHVDGDRFAIRGVQVEAHGREVRTWRQPLLAPRSEGLAVCLAAAVDDVLHLLVRASPSPGYRDGVELGPTLQDATDAAVPPPLRTLAVDAPPATVLFESVLSEEGGRFWDARTRYRLVAVDDAAVGTEPPGFRWMSLHQLGSLLQHSHYVNVELRTLVAAAHGLAATPGDAA